MNKYQWQQDIIEGLPKGKLHLIGSGRGIGKSYFTRMYMESMFSSSYTEWKEIWTWPWNSKISIYGKKIWGKISTRHCKISLNGDGSRRIQYATEKEVFKKAIRDGKGW